jgi:hypothetical protein
LKAKGTTIMNCVTTGSNSANTIVKLSNFDKLAIASCFLVGSEASHPLIGVASALDGYFAHQTLSAEICLDELIWGVVEFCSPGEVIFGDEVEVAMYDVVIGRIG